MIEISLTQGYTALIDDEDYDLVSQYKWCTQITGTKYYAVSRTSRLNDANKKQHRIYMHRLILNPPKKTEIDHIDGDGLNNQKNNIRVCSHKENQRNQLKHKDGKTGYKGLYYRDGKYEVYANHTYIGSFIDEIDAAKAYDIAAKKYFGEFANLNFQEI
jgi:hypothetical protein